MAEIHQFAKKISSGITDVHAKELILSQANTLSVHYAPFDHINKDAQIVIVGLTPGEHQSSVALKTMHAALTSGETIEAASVLAKNTASFSGPMRANLINLLDHFLVNQWLDIVTCAALFEERTDLVHYTSALRYPVFKDGKNYSGSPHPLKTPLLKDMVGTYLAAEANALPDALFVPLGPVVTDCLLHLAKIEVLKSSQILDGIPHPSGANAERISYILGRKPREALSAKTNADKLDAASKALRYKMAALLG